MLNNIGASKIYKCKFCDHILHRDAHASFMIAVRAVLVAAKSINDGTFPSGFEPPDYWASFSGGMRQRGKVADAFVAEKSAKLQGRAVAASDAADAAARLAFTGNPHSVDMYSRTAEAASAAVLSAARGRATHVVWARSGRFAKVKTHRNNCIHKLMRMHDDVDKHTAAAQAALAMAPGSPMAL
jgi:hypothetical protein